MTWFVLAFASAVFSALSTLAEKKSLFSMDALDFSYIVSVVTLVFSIPFFIMAPVQQGLTTSLIILFIKTVLSATAFLFVMLSIKNLELSEALPLLAISPGLVAVLAFFCIGDALSILEWLGIFLIIIGTYVLELKKNNGGIFAPFKTLFKSSKYGYVLGAVVLFTVTSLMDRILLKGYKLPPFTFMAYQQLFYGIVFLLIILCKKRSAVISFKSLDKKMWRFILIVAVFTVAYRYTQIAAVKLAAVGLVLAVKRLSILIAIIIGGKLFNEQNLGRRVVAAIIIIIGISMLVSSGGGM
jgi:drug/metabolite transporter (DMT)-like permease